MPNSSPDGDRHPVFADDVERYDGMLFPGDTMQAGLNQPAVTVLTANLVPLEAAGLDPAVVARVLSAPQYSLWSIGGSHARCLNLTVTLAGGSGEDGGSTNDSVDTAAKPADNAADDASPAAAGKFSGTTSKAMFGLVGTSLLSQTRSCGGFRLENNTFESSGRVLVKTGPGIIAGNTLVSAHGVVVNPELPPGGAAGIADLFIINNVIAQSGGHEDMPYSSQAGAVSIAYGNSDTHQYRNASVFFGSPGVAVFSNIVVSNNTFTWCHGANLVVSTATNVTVHRNTFANTFMNRMTNTGADYHVPTTSLIYLVEVDGASFTDNIVVGKNSSTGTLGPEATACAVLGAGVTNVTGLSPATEGNTTSAWCRVL
jgi:hypothetical protein